MNGLLELAIPAVVVGVVWAVMAMWLCSLLGKTWDAGRLFLLIVVFPFVTLTLALLTLGGAPGEGWILVILGAPAAAVAAMASLKAR